jgi:hydrogenase-4 component B
MSGVMIKLGIYGLLRVLTFLGPPPPWWGGALLGVGAVSGVAGIVHALAQRDLKRMLAYSSIENVGVIAIGLGLGLLGQAHGAPAVAFLGYAGALMHVLAHGLMKGLLFQCAGSVLHGAGTRDIDALGGLARRMRLTSVLFCAGAVAIAGLPPLVGFAGEWLIYLGALRAGADLAAPWGVVAAATFATLALIGGLAAACFVRAHALIFLGEPRTAAAGHAHEAGAAMLLPMFGGAALCVLLGVWPAAVLRLVTPVAMSVAGLTATPAGALEVVAPITLAAAVLLGLIALLAAFRAALLRRREVTSAVTWGCGYASPTARMQYTSPSFVQPLLAIFTPLVHARVRRSGPAGPFPPAATYEEHHVDMAGERLLVPASRRFVAMLSRLRIIQQGRVHLYLAYMFVTLVALLVWQLAGVS